MKSIIRTLGLAGLLVVGSASLLAAQNTDGADANATDAGPTAPMPADSMAIGEKYVDWLIDYRADSLWTHLSDDVKERLGSVGDMRDQMGQIFRQIGNQGHVASQRYWMRNGEHQFWHTADFSNIDEPVVIRFVIEPDGTITGLGINPQSQNPPVDDPNQHGEGVTP
jgi:hypothetical protein